MRRSLVAFGLATSVVLSTFTITSANAAAVPAISGGGSSFQANFEAACRQAYNATSATQVSYDGTLGSGTGMTNFKNATTDFAGTDGPDLTKVPTGQTAVVVPISAAPIAVIYKVKTTKGKVIKGLRLNAGLISNIYTGSVKYWDDKSIKKANPSIAKSLPHVKIVPMVRAAGSGTTKNLTGYLAALVPTVGWVATKDFVASANPTHAAALANITQQANSDAMVAGVGSTNGAIGYADLPDTLGSAKFQIASVKNNKGQFIRATAASGSKFVNGVGAALYANGFVGGSNATRMFQMRISGAYPITAITYVQASATTSDKNAAVRDYVQYAISSCQGKAGFSRLSGAALVIAQLQVAKIGAS